MIGFCYFHSKMSEMIWTGWNIGLNNSIVAITKARAMWKVGEYPSGQSMMSWSAWSKLLEKNVFGSIRCFDGGISCPLICSAGCLWLARNLSGCVGGNQANGAFAPCVACVLHLPKKSQSCKNYQETTFEGDEKKKCCTSYSNLERRANTWFYTPSAIACPKYCLFGYFW